MSTTIANFFFEAGNLAKTPRSFHGLLGSGTQSVAEHINRMCYIAYALGKVDGTVDISKMLQMVLFHDFSESRISDLNYVHQKYVDRNEEEALIDFTQALPFGGDIATTVHEYEARESQEAMYVKDTDNLEFIASLKEQIDIGNNRAAEWLEPAVKRVKTILAIQFADAILTTKSDDWWYGDKQDDWWIHRNKS